MIICLLPEHSESRVFSCRPQTVSVTECPDIHNKTFKVLILLDRIQMRSRVSIQKTQLAACYCMIDHRVVIFFVSTKKKVLQELTLAPLLRSVCISLFRTFCKCIVLLFSNVYNKLVAFSNIEAGDTVIPLQFLHLVLKPTDSKLMRDIVHIHSSCAKHNTQCLRVVLPPTPGTTQTQA